MASFGSGYCALPEAQVTGVEIRPRTVHVHSHITGIEAQPREIQAYGGPDWQLHTGQGHRVQLGEFGQQGTLLVEFEYFSTGLRGQEPCGEGQNVLRTCPCGHQ